MLDRHHEHLGQDADNNGAAALARKVSFLSRPDSYEPKPDTVVTRETHMSWVFMAAERVYKLKKPVRFPYLDFSTLERRARACRAEAKMNRRLAPDVYFGVVPLIERSTGYAIGGSGRIAEWLVVMRRLDESQTLEAALTERKATEVQVRRLAANLSRFYSHAPRIMVSPERYRLTLQKALAVDRRVLLHPAFDLPQGIIQRIAQIELRFLQHRSEQLSERVHQRFIRDGHGDLRPQHIWLSGTCPIIDCLEFDVALRASDALDELAFLHLECERLGGRWVGDFLRRRLAVLLADNPNDGLFLFYRIGRAMLRARLSIAHLADANPRTPGKWPRLARMYLSLAHKDAIRLERMLTGQIKS